MIMIEVTISGSDQPREQEKIARAIEIGLKDHVGATPWKLVISGPDHFSSLTNKER